MLGVWSLWGCCGIGTLGLCRCVAVPCQTVGRRAVACVCRCACVRSLTLESRVHEHSRRVLVCALSSGAERAGTRGAAACPHAWGGLCAMSGCRRIADVTEAFCVLKQW